MKNNKKPLKGIYKALVLNATVQPDRKISFDDPIDDNKIKYGFNCIVKAYELNGELAGEAEGGGVHNFPLSHTSPAIKFLRALQDKNIEDVSGVDDAKGASLFVEIETKIIPSLGVRNVIKKFISRREMSLADWNREVMRNGSQLA